MTFTKSSKVSPYGVAAACVAAVGAAVAITYFLRRTGKDKPGQIIDRCLRAVDEIERQLFDSAAQA